MFISWLVDFWLLARTFGSHGYSFTYKEVELALCRSSNRFWAVSKVSRQNYRVVADSLLTDVAGAL